eukprot:CAMPEP_0182547882 /NCGR_PEP_ID=MMETSP1323-20130603/38066_1 /TAXON_ID=236787 /ORGANISM="Florenciella parvula, Strain RCC1693" /LENGTH=118 /DNA_ID=CAMNT_0024759231 /DNA_START=58 /DNA_END=411 /DNA_ORIENTATION=+
MSAGRRAPCAPPAERGRSSVAAASRGLGCRGGRGARLAIEHRRDFGAVEADDLVDLLAVLEELERGHPRDLLLLRDPPALVDVHLGERHARVLQAPLPHHRRRGSARRAPRRVEVDER